MRTRGIAAAELALIAPATIFMTALFVRSFSPLQYEPAHTAQRLVMWYSGRMWTLWVLLLALPFTVLITGCVTLRHTWNRDVESARQSLSVIRTHLTTLVVAAATLAAAGILAIVILHMAAN
jgi:ABC-type Fe3+ transport system permease subunit